VQYQPLTDSVSDCTEMTVRMNCSSFKTADVCTTNYVQNTTSKTREWPTVSARSHKKTTKSLQMENWLKDNELSFMVLLLTRQSGKSSRHPETDQLQVHHL